MDSLWLETAEIARELLPGTLGVKRSLTKWFLTYFIKIDLDKTIGEIVVIENQ